MAALLQRLRDGTLRCLRLLARGEGPDPFHQIASELDSELVRLACGELPASFVLRESVFRSVGGLADVERREGARTLRAISGEFDDVDRVGARR